MKTTTNRDGIWWIGRLRTFVRAGFLAAMIGTMLLPAGGAPAQGQTRKLSDNIVRVLGKGNNPKRNPVLARKSAIANGLNQAVIQTVVALMPPDLLVAHFKEMVALFDRQANAYIQRYKVLAEEDAEKEYRVLIEVTVLRKRIKEAIDQAGLMVRARPLPAVLFLVAEKSIGETASRFWWHDAGAGKEIAVEKALARALGDQGYRIASHAIPLGDGVERMTLNAVEAVNIGRHYHADVVIAGQAMARLAKNTRVTDLKTYEGALTVRVYQVNSGAQVAISHAQAVAVNTDDTAGAKSVLQLVANEAATDIIRQLSAHRRHPGESALAPITVAVSGTDNLRRFVALRQAFSHMPGVTRMQIEALTPPAATLIVFFRGSADQLVKNLNRLQSNSLKINVTKTDDEHVQVTLLP